MPFPWIAAAIVTAAVAGAASQPKTPKIPDAPKPEDAMDVVDKINGVQTVIIKGANGKYQKVTSRLPRTKEEKETMQWATDLLGSTMQNLHELYQRDPNSAPSYAPLIETFANLNEERIQDLAGIMGGEVPTQQKFTEEVKAFKEMQSNVLEDAYRREQNRLAENLIQNGHLDSSAANEMRAHLARNKVMAVAQNNINAETYGTQLTDQRFARDMSIYGAEQEQKLQGFNLRNQARASQLQKATMEYQAKADEEARNIHKEQGKLGLVDSILSKDLSKAQNSHAPAMHAAGHQQQLQTHQANMTAQQHNYANRMANPNMGQVIGKAGMQVGGMYLGNELYKDAKTPLNNDFIPTIDNPFKTALPKYKFKI